MLVVGVILVSAIVGLSSSVIPEVANPQVRNFLESYDRSQPPPNAPVTARIGVYINSFTIFEKESLFEMVMYFRVSWRDDRLTALFTEEEAKNTTFKKRIEYSAQKYFWKPDLFFRNQREVIQRGSIANEALFTVNSTGHVWYVTTQVNTYSCHGLPRRYTYAQPTIVCPVMIESYSHLMDNLALEWLLSPVDVDPGVILQDFTLTSTSLINCTTTYSAGTFPCLTINFHLSRNEFFDHVGNVMYISSTLLLVTAWASFWLDGVRQMTKRLSLCIGTTMILILELGGAATWYEEWDLMGNKAQFWLAFCTLMTTLVVCETAIVHIVMVNIVTKLKGTSSVDPVQMTSEGQEMDKGEGTVGRIIDVVFGMVLYPAVFIIFIFVFFIKHYFYIKLG